MAAHLSTIIVTSGARRAITTTMYGCTSAKASHACAAELSSSVSFWRSAAPIIAPAASGSLRSKERLRALDRLSCYRKGDADSRGHPRRLTAHKREREADIASMIAPRLLSKRHISTLEMDNGCRRSAGHASGVLRESCINHDRAIGPRCVIRRPGTAAIGLRCGHRRHGCLE